MGKGLIPNAWVSTENVACPYCKVGPSQRCIDMRTGFYSPDEAPTTVNPHPERFHAATLVGDLITGKADARQFARG